MSNEISRNVTQVIEMLEAASENMVRVYDAGYREGSASAADTGYSLGRREEYDNFWDAFQEDGSRRDYKDAFGAFWNAKIFTPKYDIIAEGDASGIFRDMSRTPVPNIKTVCKNFGIRLDLSGATSLAEAFKYCSSPELPTLDLSLATDLTDMFSYSEIVNVEKIISSETTEWSETAFGYYNQSDIEHCIFDGVIAKSIDITPLRYLDKESIVSLVNTLSNETNGLEVKIMRSAVNKAFETSTGANNGVSSAEWTSLAGSKPNWNINLSEVN